MSYIGSYPRSNNSSSCSTSSSNSNFSEMGWNFEDICPFLLRGKGILFKIVKGIRDTWDPLPGQHNRINSAVRSVTFYVLLIL